MAGDARGRDGVAAVRERQRVAEPHVSDERHVGSRAEPLR